MADPAPPAGRHPRFAQSIARLSGIVAAAILKARRAEPLEFDQMLVRYAIGLIITVYAIISYLIEDAAIRSGWMTAGLLAGSWVLGAGFLVHLALWPERRVERRTASICADAAALSLLLGVAEQSAAMFFPVYLWVTLGNGFRFGLFYMYGAIAANLAGFVTMAALTHYWRESWQFCAGLALAIVVIPLYVASLIKKLRRAMDDAEAASRAKTEFLSMMSHELRTPLNAILGLAQLSKATATSAKERFSAASTELAAGRLLRMVDTILKFQRIESGGAERHDRAFDPLEMLSEVRVIIKPLAEQKGLKFRIHFLTGLPPMLRSDPDHIQTIVLNLATNAVKYTRQGRVDLDVSLRDEGKRSIFRVDIRDTGEGIPPETQSRIFERFVRGDEHNVSAEPGVGLGLSMCRSLAELLGGKLGCESVLGQGSTFWARLPVESDAARDGQTPRAPIAWLGPPQRKPAGLDAADVESVEALKALEEGEGSLSAYVLIADPGAVDEALLGELRALAAQQDHRPALILLNAPKDATGELRTEAAAVIDAAHAAGKGALIDTIRRWQWRLSQEFAASTPEITPLSRRYSVLVADDNALNREVTKRMLELQGHQVILADTGDEALHHLLSGHAEFAFLDVNMPGLSGIEVCKSYIGALGSDAHIPMLALTADISASTREECLRAGMLDVLAKPVTLEQLHGALTQAEQAMEGHSRSAPAIASPQGEAEQPVADTQRIAFLQQLFGEEPFRVQFLAGFRRDVTRNLEFLRQGLEARHSGTVRQALHAIKSSAGTAGARRLFRTAERLEKSDLNAQAEQMEADLEREFERFCEVAETLLPETGDERARRQAG